MTFNSERLTDIEKYGSYFTDEQVRALRGLHDYWRQHDQMPTAGELALFLGCPEVKVRADLHQVSLEGLLWVFGVES